MSDEDVNRTMTTFQMDSGLKRRAKDYCRANGLYFGAMINRAVAEYLDARKSEGPETGL